MPSAAVKRKQDIYYMFHSSALRIWVTYGESCHVGVTTASVVQAGSTNDLKHETTIRETVVGNEYFPRSARAGAELIGAESQKNEQYKTTGKEGNNFRPWSGIEPPRPEL